jgi:hypothetical protein
MTVPRGKTNGFIAPNRWAHSWILKQSLNHIQMAIPTGRTQGFAVFGRLISPLSNESVATKQESENKQIDVSEKKG